MGFSVVSAYILVLLFAALFDAFRDTVYAHFSTSVFRKLDPHFWWALESWRYTKRLLGMPVDAWHIFKSVTYILLFTFPAIVGAERVHMTGSFLLDTIICYAVCWVLWGIVFNFFYSVVLREKNT